MKYFAGGFLIALAAILVVLGVVFVVQRESREIRETVKDSVKEAAQDSVDRAVERAPETAARSAARVMGSIIGSPGISQEPTARDSGPATESPTKAERSPAVDPADVVGQLFQTGHHLAKSADDIGQQVLALDDEQELEIGRELHQLILDKHKCVASKVNQRIAELAAPIVANCRRKNIHYVFTVVDDPAVNAFSHLGGYVYVHTGILEQARQDAELQFVLAHEIGHVDQKHCSRALTYAAHIPKWSDAAAAQLARVAYGLIAVGYDKELEFEADEFAYRNMLRIGRSRDEALEFPRHFAKYVAEQGLENPRRRPSAAPDAVVQQIENHFRTHPPAEERLRRLESIKL